MSSMIGSVTRALLLGTVASLAANWAYAAETEAADVSEVVVTGTSIKGVAPVGSPAQTVNAEEIKATGLTNFNDILRTNPAFVNLGMSEGRGGGNQGAQANITQGSSVNLRGLGQESTLVLIDGRRIQASGTQGNFYDVSTIPVNAIQRVETVADGASAIYGSEAVGGVVNFITKRNYDGAETSVRYGDGKGFHEWRFLQNAGKTWKGGDAFFALEHYERSPGLYGTARREVTQDLRPLGGPDLRANFGSPGTIVVSGVTYAVPRGQNGRGLTSSQLVAGTQNLLDLNLSRSILSDLEKDNFLLNVRQQVNDNLRVWYAGYISQKELTYEGTSLNGGATTAALTVPRANPFFVAPSATATSVVVNYAFLNDFRAVDTAKERGWQNAVGFNWDHLPFDWSLEGLASHARNRASRFTTGQLRTINLAAALADPNPATAFNPFCDGFAFKCNDAGTLARLNGFSIIAARLQLTDYSLKASGSLFDVWGGPIRAAVGLEYTDGKVVTENGRNTVTVDPAIRVTSASRTVKSYYGELLVPLVSAQNAMAGVQRLELSLAARHEDYSDFGTTTNPKVGIRWDPVEDLSLRATYGTSFRAPTISNIDFLSTTTYSIVNLPDPRGGQVRALQLVGARAGLQPESATTYSVGFDWRPKSIRGLSVSGTLYDIDYKDRIAALPISTVLANEATLPQFVIRNPSAELVNSFLNTPYLNTPTEPAANIKVLVDGRTSNLGGVKQRGIDLNVDYQWDTAIGTLQTGLNGTILLRAKQSLFKGAAFVDVLDHINYPVSKRGRAHLGWRNDGWRADLFADYVDDYLNDLVAVPLERHVKSWLTFDASASYSFGDSWPRWAQKTRIAVNASNLFDKHPPAVINISSGVQGLYDSQAANVIGRQLAVELTRSW